MKLADEVRIRKVLQAGGPGSGRRPEGGVAHPEAHTLLINRGFQHLGSRPTATGSMSEYRHSSGRTAMVHDSGQWKMGQHSGVGLPSLYSKLKTLQAGGPGSGRRPGGGSGPPEDEMTKKLRMRGWEHQPKTNQWGDVLPHTGSKTNWTHYRNGDLSVDHKTGDWMNHVGGRIFKGDKSDFHKHVDNLHDAEVNRHAIWDKMREEKGLKPIYNVPVARLGPDR